MRQVTPADAPELARLIHTLWSDDNPEPERIARVSLETNHVTLVEIAGDGSLIGFVDAFSTVSAEGVLRWEVDLLGVHPDYRGRGIAQLLVSAAVEAGRAFGAQAARALVRADNSAASNTFQRCGFHAAAEVDLHLSDRAVSEMPALPGGAHLVSVATLTYSGVWVEGALSAEALRCAQAARTRFGWDVAGTVVPAGQQAADYQLVGRYRWLDRALG